MWSGKAINGGDHMITKIEISRGACRVSTQLVHKKPIFYRSDERIAWENEMQLERNAWEDWKKNANRCIGISDITNIQTGTSTDTSNATQRSCSNNNEASIYFY